MIYRRKRSNKVIVKRINCGQQQRGLASVEWFVVASVNHSPAFSHQQNKVGGYLVIFLDSRIISVTLCILYAFMICNKVRFLKNCTTLYLMHYTKSWIFGNLAWDKLLGSVLISNLRLSTLYIGKCQPDPRAEPTRDKIFRQVKKNRLHQWNLVGDSKIYTGPNSHSHAINMVKFLEWKIPHQSCVCL